MNKSYIVVIGVYDPYTTEQIVLKETKVDARDQYAAHKISLFKCNTLNHQTVLRVLDYNTKRVLFDHLKGFNG